MAEATDPILFGEWSPDLGDFNNPGALMIKNCLSQGEIYKPFGSLSEATDSLPGKCIGGYAYRDAAGNTTIFAATKTAIYKLDGTEWDEVTRDDGIGGFDPYTGGDDSFFDFISYGNLIIATNYNDDIQVYDMGSSSQFEELSSTAPRARRVFAHKNFLIALDTVDGDGAIGYRVRWSPLGDPQGDWTPDPDTQADFQDILAGDYANVFGADMGDYAVIVQGKSLWRMEYVGGDTIFNITKIAQGVGSILPRACISNGFSIFFPGEDGFYEFDGSGGSINPIGTDKIDKYFYTNFDETYDFNMNSVIDPLKKNVLWSFPSLDAVEGAPDLMLCFNWSTRRFTLIEQAAQLLFSFLTIGYTLDGLYPTYPDLDLIPYSLDSRIWTGGKTVLGGFSSDGKMGAFAGAPLTATIITPEIRPNASGRSLLAALIAYIEGGSYRARLGYRNRITDALKWTPFKNMNSMTGEIDFLKDATFFRAEIEISGDWQTAHSVAPRADKSGQF